MAAIDGRRSTASSSIWVGFGGGCGRSAMRGLPEGTGAVIEYNLVGSPLLDQHRDKAQTQMC